MTAFLQATPLAIRRGTGAALSFPALSLAAGDRVLLHGASGSGKTTWLSALAGLLPPDTGRIAIDGADLYSLSAGRRDRLRGSRMGFVSQALHLLPGLTLRQNVALAATMAGKPANAPAIDTLLVRLGLAGKAHHFPHALSQGEQQRAAIARAVLNRPALILADEPTSALDDRSAADVMSLLESCAGDTGAALLVSTHDARLTGRFSRFINLVTPS